MRTLLLLLFAVLLIKLQLASCGKPDTTTCKNNLLGGYYVKYSSYRKLYAVCHVVPITSYDYRWVTELSLKKDTSIVYDTIWLKNDKKVFTMSKYEIGTVATFKDSCSAKEACIESLSTDGVTTDFK